jgi:hypothetical protein
MENKDTSSKTASLIKTILYWVTTSIIVLETAAGAQWDLARNPYVTKVFAELGYPLYLLTIIGLWKIPAAITLIIPRFPLIKEWAYAGLFFIYTGAAASHIAMGDYKAVWGLLVFSGITVVSWALRPANRRM